METASRVPVEKLAIYCDPFRTPVWGVRITHSDVKTALAERRLVSVPGTDDHAGRIAFLVEHEAVDPIEIDVGIPVLNYCPAWMVLDGNHRLAAAIYARREFIPADITGQISHAEKLFGVKMPE